MLVSLARSLGLRTTTSSTRFDIDRASVNSLGGLTRYLNIGIHERWSASGEAGDRQDVRGSSLPRVHILIQGFAQSPYSDCCCTREI